MTIETIIRKSADQDLEWALGVVGYHPILAAEVSRRAEIRIERGESGNAHYDAAWYEPRPLCHHHDASGYDGVWECDHCSAQIPAPVPGSYCGLCRPELAGWYPNSTDMDDSSPSFGAW